MIEALKSLQALNPYFCPIFFTGFVILSFGLLVWLKNRKAKANFVFRRGEYDIYKALIEALEETANTIDLGEVVKNIHKSLSNAIASKKIWILLKKEEEYYLIQDGNLSSEIILSSKNAVSKLIEEKKETVEKWQINEETARWFNDNGIEIVVPLRLKNRVLGLLALGEKLNLKTYSVNDIKFLENIGRVTGAALSNSIKQEELVQKEKNRVKDLEKIAETRTGELINRLNELEKTKTALYNVSADFKELNDILKEERDRLGAIISSIGEGLLLIDTKYKILLMNLKAGKMLGGSLVNVIGQDVKKIINVFKGEKEIPDNEQPVEKMFKTGEPVFTTVEDNFYFKGPSNKKFPVALVVTPLKGDDITGAIVVFRDITEEKRLDEAKSGFISIASHQLRTPLTSIRWYTEMLNSEDVGPLNKDQKEFIARVYSGALKLNDVIELLLALSRIESGNIQIKLAKINIVSFTQDILKELEPQWKQKNIEVSLAIQEKQLPEIKLDISMLRQVITNLLSNSIRYTDDSGRIEISIRKEPSGNEMIYSVKDDGIGVPESFKDKIFQKFSRAENAINKAPDGSGLGLSLVKSLIEMWKGKVWFESPAIWINKKGEEYKKGSIFSFTIPLIK